MTSRSKLVVLLVAAVLLCACGRKAAAPQWLTAEVRQGNLEDVVLATGTLRASKLVNVGAQVSGQVKVLHVKLGQQVRRGDLIAEIDATEQRNQLRDERASIAVTTAQRASRLASLAQARANYKRQQTMMREDATSKQELQAAQAAMVSAETDLAVLEAQLNQAGIRLENASVKLGYTRIVAPMDGVVVAVVTEAGQTLNSVQSVPTVVKLAVLDPMTIEAQISEADVAKVKAGMPASFTLLGNSDKRYPTQLTSVDPAPVNFANETSSANSQNAVYYNALFEVPNPNGELRISMTTKVSVVTRSAKNVLLVPSAALQKAADGSLTVRVMKGSDPKKATIESRKVKVGLNNRVDAEVLSGLTAGETVVVGQAGAADTGAEEGGMVL